MFQKNYESFDEIKENFGATFCHLTWKLTSDFSRPFDNNSSPFLCEFLQLHSLLRVDLVLHKGAERNNLG